MLGKASEIKTALFNPEVTEGEPLDYHINKWIEENEEVEVIAIQYTENMINERLTRCSALIIYKEPKPSVYEERGLRSFGMRSL